MQKKPDGISRTCRGYGKTYWDFTWDHADWTAYREGDRIYIKHRPHLFSYDSGLPEETTEIPMLKHLTR
jgi:hypothetical protein